MHFIVILSLLYMLEHNIFNIVRQLLSFYQTLNEHIDALIASKEYIDNTVSFTRIMFC